MEVKTTFDAKPFLDQMEGNLAKNLGLAGFYATNQLKLATNRTQPMERHIGPKGIYYRGLDPSKPGENPKRLSGKLQRGFAFETADNVLTIGNRVPGYPRFLQEGTVRMEPRPWKTLFETAHLNTIANIVLTGKPK